MIESNRTNEFLRRLEAVEYEPTRVQGIVMDMFESALEHGVNISDPGTPAMKLLEMSVMLSTAAIRNDEILDRKSYPYMALNESDLFGHMSDKDYLDMFAVPGESTFNLYFSRSELIDRSIEVGNSAIRKITIPKHTRIVAGGIPFTMQYPIDFLIKRNGALDVVFDLSKESPLQHLSTNKVEWNVIQVAGVNDKDGIMDIINISVPVKQMLQTSYYTTVSSSTVLKKRVKFDNKFYYVRAYLKDGLGKWNEIKTTFNEQTFDIATPTLLLKVVDDELIYELPYIYLMGNLNGREIRVDVYTTNGKYDVNLGELDRKQFSVEFKDLDDDDNGIYTAPISILDTFDIRNTGYTTGGRDAPSFRERREAVINNNIGEIKLPVTGGQMDTAIKRLGFDSALAIDDITRRTYIASRKYPTVSTDKSIGIDAGTITLRSSFDKLASLGNVYDNHERLILSPDLIYSTNLDGLRILSEDEINELNSLDKETLVNRLNQNNYLWSPFHYVLDIGNNRFESIAYLMTLPEVKYTSYLGSNEETGLLVMTGDARRVEYRKSGYRITITSDSSKSFKDIPDEAISVQLMVKDGSVYGYMNGEIKGRNSSDHLIVEFNINTNWNIVGDTIEISGFKMKNGSDLSIFTPLETDFELIWSVRTGATEDVVPGSLDTTVGSHLLDGEYSGIYHEVLAVKMGSRLNRLWTGARMVIGDRSPKRYEEDVYLTYGPTDVSRYKIDPVTNLPEVKVVNGKNELIVLHEVGDPVLDPSTGEPIILHPKGSIIVNLDGEIEYESDRFSQWWVDLTLFDARFKFATTDEIVDYVKYISKLSVGWSNDLLEELNNTALERTKVYFSPKNSINDITVIADDTEEIRINPSQSLTVDLYVLKSVYQDHELRNSLETTVVEDLIEGISHEVVSMSDLEEKIMSAMPNDVVSVKISGLGGSMDYRVITVIDGRNRLSIAKELYIDSDHTIGIRNDIRVIFRLHGDI